MPEEQLYYKAGSRYYPAHTTMRGWFPIDGVWLVEYRPGHEHGRLIAERLGDLPDPLHLAAMERHRDAICDAILNGTRGDWRRVSATDLASAIIRALERETREVPDA